MAKWTVEYGAMGLYRDGVEQTANEVLRHLNTLEHLKGLFSRLDFTGAEKVLEMVKEGATNTEILDSIRADTPSCDCVREAGDTSLLCGYCEADLLNRKRGTNGP